MYLLIFHLKNKCISASSEEALVGVKLLLKRLGGWPIISDDWQDKPFTWEKFSKCARRLGFLPRMFLHIGLNADDVEKPWNPNDTIELTVERAKYITSREDMMKTMMRGHEYLEIAQYLAENKKPNAREIEEALQFARQIHMVKN